MIVITGASDGLGLELAKIYSQSGKIVVNISRRESDFATENILSDLLDAGQIKEAAKKLLLMEEPLETLINCAGVLSAQPMGNLTTEELHRVMSTNVEAAMMLVSDLNERLLKDETDIVNIASTMGLRGYGDLSAYTVSKWAMRGFSASLQDHFKNSPNRVISFCPGTFTSQIYQKATNQEGTKSGDLMNPADLAVFIKQILDLPKIIEISEVIVTRKKAGKK
jgi:short-subunit dehydrogenase